MPVGAKQVVCQGDRTWSSPFLDCVEDARVAESENRNVLIAPRLQPSNKRVLVSQPIAPSQTTPPQSLPIRPPPPTPSIVSPKLPKKHIQQGATHQQGRVVIEDAKVAAPVLGHRPQSAIINGRQHLTNIQQASFKPFIKCPRDTTIILPKGKSTVLVKLEQPQTNVNWQTHVDVRPTWAKNLNAFLGAGTHKIAFRARSPFVPNAHVICRTIITVKSANVPTVHTPPPPTPPAVEFCPTGISVQLQPGETQRIVHWKEPSFRSAVQLKQIFKSRQSGDAFTPGLYHISYVATDVLNRAAQCQFDVSVKAARKSPPIRLFSFP